MNRKWIYLSSLLPLALTGSVLANSLDQVNNSARFSFIIRNVNYKEISTQRGQTLVLDSNKGTIPGLGLSLTHTFSWIYLATQMNMTQGETPYTGATQQGNIPINNPNAPSFIFNTSGNLGIVLSTGDHFAFIPYADIGYHSWERSSLPARTVVGGPTEGGQENYHNDFWGGGLRLEALLGHSTVLSFFGTLGRTFNGYLFNPKTPAFPGQNDHVGATYHVKDRNWYDVGGDVDFEIVKHLHLFAAAIYTHFKYGKSEIENRNPADLNDGSDEPDSITKYITGYLGIGYDTANYNGQGLSSNNTFYRLHNQVMLAYIRTWINYLLSPQADAAADNIQTGRYKGPISGWQLNMSKTWDHVLLNVFNRYSTGGNLTFTSTAGNNITTTTEVNYYRGGLDLGYVAELSNTLALVPEYVLGYEHDNYMIKKTSLNIPQSNIYYFFYTGLGLGLDVHAATGLMLTPTIASGFTFHNIVYSPLSEVQFKNSAAPWLELGLKADYAVSHWLHFIAGVEYRHVSFKESKLTEDQNTSGVFATMPAAHYNNVSMTAGLAFDLP